VSALNFHYREGGIHLPRLGLWLDAHRATDGVVCVSHAHSDHTARHTNVIVTEATAKFMRHRLGGRRQERILAFGERTHFETGDVPYHLTLLPAGHIIGSAMVFLEADGESLLYTGDFKLRPNFAAEACQPRRADRLIMETTFGLPRYAFPDEAEVWGQILEFCRTTLNDSATPVLFAYSLGKSQELLAGLRTAGLPIVLHKETAKLTEIAAELGWKFPPYEVFSGNNAVGKVLIAPPQSTKSILFQQLARTRTAVVTGWAMDPSCRFRSGTDAAFPLSDHADFPSLIEFVQRVAPQRVFTLHGYAADFARTLRELGFQAQALSESEQLDLPLGVSSSHLAAFTRH
jgi:Cft2 family RNA processing exonuclease